MDTPNSSAHSARPRWRIVVGFSLLCQRVRRIGLRLLAVKDAHEKLWGWAADGEKVTIHFLDSTYHAAANARREWEVTLSNLKAGGPHDMRIEATNSINVHDILVGDVWVCSGQSNMGLPMGALMSVYPDDIAASKNLYIRQYSVPVSANLYNREGLPASPFRTSELY